MAVKNVKKVPLTVPGEGMAEFVRRAPQWIKSDSSAVTFDGDTSVNLFELPGNSLVTKILVHVETAFQDGSGSAAPVVTITVPNDTGTETVYNADSTNGVLLATGFHAATGFALTPSSGGYVTAAIAPGTTTTGALEVFMEYVPLGDRL